MSIQEYIDNTEMGIAFSDLENEPLETLNELIEKYKKINFDYKTEKFPQNETIKVFGDKPIIYIPDTKIINTKLINLYRKQLMKNYSKLLELKKIKMIEIKKIKSKETKQKYNKKYYNDNKEKIIPQVINNYHKRLQKNNDSIICTICKGKYKSYNKKSHDKTLKHSKALEIPIIDETINAL